VGPKATDVGYGNVKFPGTDPMTAVTALPDVQAAQLDLLHQGALADANYRTNLSQLIATYGDPTVLPRINWGLGASTLPGQAGGQTLSQALGMDVDPATGELAANNTVGPGGTIGNSVVAQMYLAAQQARSHAINTGLPWGAAGSSQLGYNLNQGQIDYGQQGYNALQKLQAAQGNLTQTWQGTKLGLEDAVTKAVQQGLATVNANPSAYGVQTPYTGQAGQVGNTGSAPFPRYKPQPYGYGSAGAPNAPVAHYGGWTYPATPAHFYSYNPPTYHSTLPAVYPH